MSGGQTLTTALCAAHPDRVLGVDQPVFCNPAALHSVQDLRTALERTNLQLAEQFNLADKLRAALVRMGQDVAPVVLAHMAGDADALDLALLRLMKRHVRVMPDPGGTAPH